MNKTECPSKEQAIYNAVITLFKEGADLSNLTVSQITAKAGIGKGTAYDYFSDKEEMIAKALFFNTAAFCKEVYLSSKEEQGFRNRMMRILLYMENAVGESSCIFRLVHILTDNSTIGKRLKELMESKPADTIMVEDVMRLTITEEFGEQSVSNEKMLYLINSSISRILCYGMSFSNPYNLENCRNEEMRRLVCQSICREAEELLAG
ncbi:MAG: TetR/AcrR family transcriptional regulator [Lachnospiraceae bacterium]|nr:TetR/AcrR family transcriptional regulator [Lachnospiraceae bacterium]